MARFRISGPAREDLANALARSLELWGDEAEDRYSAVLVAALRMIVRDPAGPLTRDRSELAPNIRSLHVKHARRGTAVRDPVHVVFYRATGSMIEVVRVLHQRMEPTLHLTLAKPPTKRPRK
jgi:toxin ParE1/3/4